MVNLHNICKISYPVSTTIGAHALAATLNHLSNAQARVAKIICGTVSSTNNEKVTRECGFI